MAKIIRDTRGTRYLYGNNEKDLFSSRKSHLKKIKDLSPNKKKLIDFLNWDYRSSEETFFNEIYRVEPSNYLYFEDWKINTKKYTLLRYSF